ncbi:hypothetical protein Aglo03_60880 [Actinokineospora globicatena]|uniref:Uncharacterized protein n=1 Tax=Actinokineospora globicatena TaxID=103729 RepID=A0A9W6QVE6_9PSEU|nr:hypothetical protein Aglo03_60880 [Actinokineospora globicatena]
MSGPPVSPPGGPALIPGEPTVYFTDRGIEELETRRGEEEVTLAWLADRMRAFVDNNPEFETATERLATFLARDDDDIED